MVSLNKDYTLCTWQTTKSDEKILVLKNHLNAEPSRAVANVWWSTWTSTKGTITFMQVGNFTVPPKQYGEDYYQKNLDMLEKAIAIIEFKIRSGAG